MRKSFLIASFLFVYHTVSAQVVLKSLLTENLKNPICIDMLAPRFSWQLSQRDNKPVVQQAYEVQVDSVPFTGNNISPLWSSGKVKSDQSVYISYLGKSLLSAHKYFWRVRIWDTREFVQAGVSRRFGKWDYYRPPIGTPNGLDLPPTIPLMLLPHCSELVFH